MAKLPFNELNLEYAEVVKMFTKRLNEVFREPVLIKSIELNGDVFKVLLADNGGVTEDIKNAEDVEYNRHPFLEADD